MSEKKRFKEPMLIKYNEKLDEMTKWNHLGSNCEVKPKRKRRWGRRVRH